MRNILAIAQKELKSYFASPIAYVVIGLFALLYGYFYAVMLQYFVRAEKAENLSAFDAEAHVFDGGDAPVAFREVLNLDHEKLLGV